VVIGGGAKSDIWAQIKADILGMPVTRPRYTEAASLGAAILAAAAVGVVTDPVATARTWNPPVRIFTQTPRLLPSTANAACCSTTCTPPCVPSTPAAPKLGRPASPCARRSDTTRVLGFRA